MAIEKMKYMNIYGPKDSLPEVLEVLTELACFHPDTDGKDEFRPNVSDNPYSELLHQAQNVLADMHVDSGETPDLVQFELQDVRDLVDTYRKKIDQAAVACKDLLEEKKLYAHARHQLRHLEQMDVNLDDIFSLKYVKVRFGRLPKEGYRKLPYYSGREFSFRAFDFDGEYYWGFYFSPENISKEVDAIFASLHFERLRVPDFVHGTPTQSLARIETHEAQLNAKIEELTTPTKEQTRTDLQTLRRMCVWLDHKAQIYNMEKYAQVLGDTFYLSGFVPKAQSKKITERLSHCHGCKVSDPIASVDAPIPPPTRLKNNWFSRPFEMYVSMYGLPAYKDIDPTSFVAITYSILFGIMFGDLGQGLVVCLVGFLLYKFKKMPLGAILQRCGVFSMIFGFLYGSVFGYEELLNPVYHAMGLAGKPLEVLSPESTNFILLGSIALGVFLILCALVYGMISKARRGYKGELFFSANGLAGFVFYAAIVGGAAALLLLNRNLFTPIFIVIGIVIPFLMMYFAEPLSHLVKTHKLHLEDGVGGTLVNGFFEMFDVLLTFASNTMSFLRIGGFVLAHAGMMSVVMTLAEMVGAGAAPVVVIIGNIFVMGMEGLIVGIQALRLEFYEMFSRFFDADGTPFAPLKLRTPNSTGSKE